jgi:hypothetical protein
MVITSWALALALAVSGSVWLFSLCGPKCAARRAPAHDFRHRCE